MLQQAEAFTMRFPSTGRSEGVHQRTPVRRADLLAELKSVRRHSPGPMTCLRTWWHPTRPSLAARRPTTRRTMLEVHGWARSGCVGTRRLHGRREGLDKRRLIATRRPRCRSPRRPDPRTCITRTGQSVETLLGGDRVVVTPSLPKRPLKFGTNNVETGAGVLEYTQQTTGPCSTGRRHAST